MKTKLLLLFAMLSLSSTGALADDDDDPTRRWGLELGMGELTAGSDGPDGQSFYLNDDKANHFYLNADYYLTRRLALTAGLHFTQLGMLTDFADGIGMKKINMMGLQVGGKFYFLPEKWILQPHVDLLLRTNVLNLGHETGQQRGIVEQGHAGNYYTMHYDVRMPALSLVPQLGVDLRLISTVSLTFNCGLQWFLWGHDRYHVTMTSGSMAGLTIQAEVDRLHTAVTLGVKVDFPLRNVRSKKVNSLIGLLLR